MPIETAEQAEARRARQRKANGSKPWHPGGPGRPPKDRSAVPSPTPRRAKAKRTRAASPASSAPMWLGPELLESLPRALVDLEERRARIDATITAVRALLA